MDFKTFKETLKQCNLTIKEFAIICGLNPKSISITWKTKDKVPKWAESWLYNYIKANTLENAFNSVKDVIYADKRFGSE